MYNTAVQLRLIEQRLADRLGEVLGRGSSYRVTDFTEYYIDEFGSDLMKQFYVFRNPVVLEDFYKIKIWSNTIETTIDQSTDSTTRSVNIDPGYLEPSKLVLFSTKNFSHRIYCGSGIYAEVTMPYARGDFIKLPWTYSDYYSEDNRRFLVNMRDCIINILRK